MYEIKKWTKLHLSNFKVSKRLKRVDSSGKAEISVKKKNLDFINIIVKVNMP